MKEEIGTDLLPFELVLQNRGKHLNEFKSPDFFKNFLFSDF